MLHNWNALQNYFEVEGKQQKSSLAKAKAKSLYEYLRSPTKRLTCIFLLYAVRLFKPMLVKLQAAEPLIHELRPSMERLLREILTKFVLPEKELTKVLCPYIIFSFSSLCLICDCFFIFVVCPFNLVSILFAKSSLNICYLCIYIYICVYIYMCVLVFVFYAISA